MPDRNTGAITGYLIELAPTNIEFGDSPTVEEVTTAARSAILDALEIDVTPNVVLSLPGAFDEIRFELEDVEGALAEQAQQRAMDDLKVKVTNGRQALAAIKAYRKAQKQL